MHKNWKLVEGFPDYEVSDLGEVRRYIYWRGKRTNTYPGKHLKPGMSTSGYRLVVLYKDKKPHTKQVHRLVADAWIPFKPAGWQVNHKNGVKTDNRLSNLECVTASENIRHAYANFSRKPTSCKGARVRTARFDEDGVREIKRRLASGERQSEVAASLGVTRHAIWAIKHGLNWGWIDA